MICKPVDVVEFSNMMSTGNFNASSSRDPVTSSPIPASEAANDVTVTSPLDDVIELVETKKKTKKKRRSSSRRKSDEIDDEQVTAEPANKGLCFVAFYPSIS